MKKIIFPFLLLFTLYTKAQTEQIVGTYNIKSASSDGIIEWKLTLNHNKTFSFYFNRDLKNQVISDPRDHQSGKGRWTTKNNYIYFHSQESDFDDTYTLDFNNSKAVFKTKHPRDKSKRVITPHLIFLETNIPWMKRLKMDKK